MRQRVALMSRMRTMKKNRAANGTAERWLRDRLTRPFGEDCVVWPFSFATPGYGQFSPSGSGKVRMAHRIVCEAVNGPAPSPVHQAAHSCGDRRCINPRHLLWKTARDNQRDRHEHGRRFTGRRRNFSEDQVREIRGLKGQESVSRLASRFGCTESNIRHIQVRSTYRHVL